MNGDSRPPSAPTHTAAAPAGVDAENGPPARVSGEQPTPAIERNEWQCVCDVARSLLTAQQVCRLYPAGHQRLEAALEDARRSVQSYRERLGSAFAFAPATAIDAAPSTASVDSPFVMKLAVLCRGHLIKTLRIRHTVAADELESFCRALLHSLPASGASSLTVAGKWENIEIEHYSGDDDQDAYRFDATGQQLLPRTRPSPGGGLQLPDSVPEGLRNSLVHALNGPGMREKLSRVRSALFSGEEGTPLPVTDNVDLVATIVKHLFRDPASYVHVPVDEITRKVEGFLDVVASLPGAARETRAVAPPPPDDEVDDLIRRAVGLSPGVDPGLAEVLGQAAQLKSLFRTRAPRGCGGVPEGGLPPAPSEAASGGDEDDARKTADGAAETDESNLSDLLPADDELRHLAAEIDLKDYSLEALQVQVELMASERSADAYGRRRSRFLEMLARHNWLDAAAFASELDDSLDVLRDQTLEDPADLVDDVLASQKSQEILDCFFASRLRHGADFSELRPIVRRMAAKAPLRALSVLAALWREDCQGDRDVYIDEVYDLAPDAVSLAEWAGNTPGMFGDDRSLKRLGKLRREDLAKVFEHLFQRPSRALSNAAGALTKILRAVASRAAGEPILSMAIRDGAEPLRRQALLALGKCRSAELIGQLTRAIDEHNESAAADLDEVRLLLTALVKSRRPEAREFLADVRSRRRMLRHVYRQEIRDILKLLEKAEALG